MADEAAPRREEGPGEAVPPLVAHRFARGEESRSNALADVVYADDEVLVFVAPKTWTGNAGNALVVPRAHHQDLYDLPDTLFVKMVDGPRDRIGDGVGNAMNRGPDLVGGR